ncbi:ACR202Wp [Eremothecium gossypii ATCC 10895]|uniref:NADPH:adrenodoxin oxidoreductase, mitochondrial n=1 Tax=Eremothecium gossypii (strain ATCC 10895 / CBS 109.51 / FGSC 9923 / NRRL Y-1056) TaxID=284811 RepID=Q75BR9_EREGS|nr:ACR202Wp [Eremothecium gossypii ATCC 10895]AAS51428.2 ACR202Wp [Eremothecium gossypii ATCC 10895]
MGLATIIARRAYGQCGRARKRVSIVGSGPSGFYTAVHLLTRATEPLHVTLWESLPTPFGLSRYGVAPDHPEVKNCEDRFTELANRYHVAAQPGEHSFEFVGNITVGRDVALRELLAAEDAVVLSYGCSGDRRLGIEGEADTAGVFTSRQFVNWYNGHPRHAQDAALSGFDWARVRRVGIIGNGNVALDIARLLLTAREEALWGQTDINPHALQALRRAPLEEVRLIGRRDFLGSKFTNKELREMWELERCGVRGHIAPEHFTPEAWAALPLDRATKRRIDMCQQYLLPYAARGSKSASKYPPPAEGYSKAWVSDYLKTPLYIRRDGAGAISALTVCKNSLTPENKVVRHLDEQLDYELDVLITSLGYRGQPLPEFGALGVAFDADRVSNSRGRVLRQDGSLIPGLFASGWIANGSRGVIMTTMMNSFAVGDEVLQYLAQSPPKDHSHGIDLRDSTHTTWADWIQIDKTEKQRAARGQPRQKLLSVAQMLEAARARDT